MSWLNQNKKNILIDSIAIIILSIPGIIGVLHSGFFTSDDGTWMVVRFSAFYEALKSGQFPVRFLPRINFGYGYPVADFLYPLFMYLATIIHLARFNFVTSIKILLGLSFILSGLFSFFWLRKKTSFLAALIGASVYMFFPYHLWDIYKRGSVGEVLALAIIPFIFWQLENENFLLSTIGTALLVTAHNVLALLFLPVILIYLVYCKSYTFKKIGIYFLITLSLSAFFWLPALFEKKYTIFDRVSVSDFSQYFLAIKNYMLFLIPFLLSMIATVIIYFRTKKLEKYILFFLLVGLVSLFFSLPVSYFFWKILPLSTYIQFPFRFLSLTILTSSFLIAAGIDNLKKKYRLGTIVVILILTYLSSWNYLLPKEFVSYPDGFYTTNMDTTTVKSEYLPQWVKKPFSQTPTKQIFTFNGDAHISQEIISGTTLSFSTAAITPSTIAVNIVYFPGWNIWIDGKQTKIYYDNPQGVMQFIVPEGFHKIYMSFSETPLRIFSDLLSFSAIIICIYLLLRKRKKEYASS